ncbi:hypothetical protein Y032_0060g3110 [Ancylostoma ceylanicum]|nr:hypothetical protein Y032_0060g3110 [Ancylostoma ceylanicum]
MNPALLLITVGASFPIVNAVVVSIYLELRCRITGPNKLLRPGHTLWVHAQIMERDQFDDDLLVEAKVNGHGRRPTLGIPLESGDVDDGLFDDWLEVYAKITHNCVKYFKAGRTRTKIIEIGKYYVPRPVYKIKHVHVDLP